MYDSWLSVISGRLVIKRTGVLPDTCYKWTVDHECGWESKKSLITTKILVHKCNDRLTCENWTDKSCKVRWCIKTKKHYALPFLNQYASEIKKSVILTKQLVHMFERLINIWKLGRDVLKCGGIISRTHYTLPFQIIPLTIPTSFTQIILLTTCLGTISSSW